jgi:hypothetical protein
MTRVGKILANYNKAKLLIELWKGPMPKSKMLEVLGIKSAGTINAYVATLLDEGLVEEEVIPKDGKVLIHMVRLKQDGILIDFSKIEE